MNFSGPVFVMLPDTVDRHQSIFKYPSAWLLLMSHPATQLGLLFSRVQSLQLHPDLHLAHLSSSTDLNEGLARRRAWQQSLNCKIQHITLQLLVGVFRYFRACHGVWAWPLSSLPSLSSRPEQIVPTLPSILPPLTVSLITGHLDDGLQGGFLGDASCRPSRCLCVLAEGLGSIKGGSVPEAKPWTGIS